MQPFHPTNKEEIHNESDSAQKDAATGKIGDQGGQGGKDNINNEVTDIHIVVATLISTVSFAAGFTMPGGYQGDKGPDQGFAILTNNVAFQIFVIANTIAMTLSSCSVMMQLYWSAYKKGKSMPNAFKFVCVCTMLALYAMVIAFISGTYAVLSHSLGLSIAVCVLGFVLFCVLNECLTYVDPEEVDGPHCLVLGLLGTIIWYSMSSFCHMLISWFFHFVIHKKSRRITIP